MSSHPAVRISVPSSWSDVSGVLLMERLGPFQEIVGEGGDADTVHLLFFPFSHGAGYVPEEEIIAALPDDPELRSAVSIERVLVPGGWEENWKLYFRPLVVGRLYIRPPWEVGPPAAGGLLDVVLTPGLAFGTGLHATTRSLLELMQRTPAGGPLLDAGTGSGILAICGARLGFRPVRAFDNDPLAVEAARTNAAANAVEVEVTEGVVGLVPSEWFRDATVLANIVLEPVLELVHRLESGRSPVRRLLVAGLLAGEQERLALAAAGEAGLQAAELLREGEWAAIDLRPTA